MQVSKGQVILGSLVTIIFGTVMALYLVNPDAIPANNQGWSMLVGALISQFTVVISWYFGSSKGSSDKTAMMGK